jgi:hypothetical protein
MSTGFSILFKMSSLVSTGLKSQVELRLISFFNINIKKLRTYCMDCTSHHNDVQFITAATW